MAVFDDGTRATELGHSGAVEAAVLLVGSELAGASMRSLTTCIDFGSKRDTYA